MSDENDKKTPPASSPRTIDGSEGRDERASRGWTLDELGDFCADGFKNMMGSIASVDRKVDRVEDRVDDIDDRVGEIEAHIFSQPPPPADAGGLAAAPRVAARVAAPRRPRMKSLPAVTKELEATSGKTDDLEGRLLKLEAKVEDTHKVATTAVDINKQQSRAQGLAMPGASFGERASRFLFSREGAKFMVAMVTAIFTGIAVLYAQRAHQDAARAADRPSVVVSPSPAGSILVAPSPSSR